MQIEVEQNTMREVHELAVAEWGRMADELRNDGMVQPLYLPNGSYATIISPASPDTLQVHQAIGRPDLERPGLGAFLLREHSRWLVGRIELVQDMLVVSHTFRVAELHDDTLRGYVLRVHQMACRVEDLLRQTGTLIDEGDEDA